MLMLDIVMTVIAIWLVGHIVLNEYLVYRGNDDYFTKTLTDMKWWQRLGTFTFWWYGLSVLTMIYFTVRMFG